VKTPVALLTGFLGSGKTTLLARLLEHAELRDTAVIVNELGEVGIDHHLLRRVDERTVLLANGCVCCALRGDLADELRDLLSRRERGEVPWFSRVAIETTGLADPAPILSTLASEPVVRHHFELETVIATVDAVHGEGQLAREPASLKQAAVADRIVVTKTDLAPADELRARLARLNPAADVVEASFGDVDPRALLRPAERDPRELRVEPPAHGDDVGAFCLFLDETLDWTAFGIWLSMLLQARGEDVLRVKGLLDVGASGPVVLNGVQHVIHPPLHLEAWPDEDRRSRIVVIGRGLEEGTVRASLEAFMRAAAA
jgi:G3E family GTPase